MMKQIKHYNKICILFFLLIYSGKGMAITEQVIDTLQCKLTFCMDSLLYVSDPENTLQEFINSMQALKSGNDSTVSIVHIGDSHIQAGFLTGQVMRLLQTEYGNAGRGWIAPFKLSKTNEPLDYFFNSNIKEWTAGRVTQGIKKSAIGPGGIGLESAAGDINFQMGVTPKNGQGYSFNEVIFYRDARSMPLNPTGRLKELVTEKYAVSPAVPGILVDTFRIGYRADTLQLKSSRVDPWSGIRLPAGDFKNIYYGAILKNGRPGVLYHSVGINGAMFVNYTNTEFMERVALLKPNILIISLGTNETFGRRFTKGEFSEQIESLISLIKEYMPNVPVLLTTPPECYKRVTVNQKKSFARNEKTTIAAEAIVDVAQKHGVACWDMFTATGGNNSCEKWFKGKWMGSDRIHFNKEGYFEQGKLFFKVLYNLIENKEEMVSNDDDE